MLHEINIFIHIAAGMIALGIGLVPMLSKKGGPTHLKYGRLFLVVMAVVIITALNGVFLFIDRPFLTLITLLSAYHSITGYRVLKTKDKGPQLLDFSILLVLLFATLSFLWKMKTANIVWHAAVIYYMLYFLLAMLAYDFSHFILPKRWFKGFWIYEHIFKMIGAYVALFSAFAGTVLQAWQPYSQIIPSALGTIWMILAMYIYTRKKRVSTS